jgi:hypothetical protein
LSFRDLGNLRNDDKSYKVMHVNVWLFYLLPFIFAACYK